MGLEMWAFMPASRQLWTSSAKAFAVMAMMGIVCPSGFLLRRMARAASSPFMTGHLHIHQDRLILACPDVGEGFCQLRTVGIDVTRRAVHFHQSRQDLCVQAVVLRAQKAHAVEDGGRLLLLNNAGIALLPDGIGQLRQEERPCKHTVHSGSSQKAMVLLRVSVIGVKDEELLP